MFTRLRIGAPVKIALMTVDAVLISTSYLGAHFLGLSGQEVLSRPPAALSTLPVVVAVSFLVHLRLGLFNAILRYASLETATAVLKSVAISVAISFLAIAFFWREIPPWNVFAIHAMASVLLIGGARLAVRFCPKVSPHRGDFRKVLLYGAGDTAELVLHGLRASRDRSHLAVGLLDHDRRLVGRQIHGLRIHGIGDLAQLVQSRRPEEIWVCVPDLSGETFREVYESARACGLRVKVLSRLEKTLLGDEPVRLEEPQISHLLRRPPRSLDRKRMENWIRGKRVLITGAGGSIGSELSRQVARLGPGALALCDACELNLFNIHGELTRNDGTFVQRPYLVDVREASAVERIFRSIRPEIVFHAAAYKHVPLVELNCCEGILTNVEGLYNVARAALSSGARDFVFVSSDKAVRPTSVMGATKRLGEIMVQLLQHRGSTCFCAVRFGNVLGSSGSVVPIFEEQIRRGEEVTVTHPEMTRYFMLVSEAVELVIQAGSMGKGGEIFILNMGAPVRIADMAADIIRLLGKEPGRDIKIRFTGPRPGEKIHEELLIDPRDFRTSHEDIWIDGAEHSSKDWSSLEAELGALFKAARAGKEHEAIQRLHALVNGFTPLHENTARLLFISPEREESPSPLLAEDKLCMQ